MASTLKEQIIEVFKSQNPHDARRLVVDIEALLEQSGDTGARQQQLQKTLAQLQFIALRYYNESEIDQLFRNHTADIVALPADVDLAEMIYDKMVTIEFVGDRDELKQTIQRAVVSCTQELTQEKIMLGNEEVRPTVQNWMKEYFSHIGDTEVASLQIARFFSSDTNVNKLDALQSQKVRRLLNLYKTLQEKSASITGFEQFAVINDPDEGVSVFIDGEISPLYSDEELNELEEQAKNKQLDALSLTSLQAQYPDRFNKYKNQDILQLLRGNNSIDRIHQQSQDFFQQQRAKYQSAASSILPTDQRMLAELQSALSLSSSAVTLAQLKQSFVLLLGHSDTLLKLLRDPAIVRFIRANIPQDLDDQSKQLLQQSTQLPVGLQVLVNTLLSKAFPLDEEAVKWHAYQILQRIPMSMKDYKTIVTYDVQSNRLSWRY